MTKKSSTPAIRFNGFTDTWEQRKLGDNIIEYTETTTKNNQYPPLTSSRKGIFLQTEYFAGNQIASDDNTGYNIVPYGYFTYRHMSDDEIFHFNINDIVENGIVSTLYPVFTTDENLDSRYLQYQLNYGYEFAKFAILQKQGGSRTYMYLNKLKQLYLTMPKSVEEQNAISAFFMSLDHLITLHQRKYDKLTNVKKSMLEKMFPKNGSNVPEIRFKGFTEAWEQRKLCDVVKEITRNDPESEAPIMMITANNGFIEQSERYAFNNAGESLKKYILLKKGELAYNHGASKLRPYGSCFALTTAENARIPFVYHCFSAENQNAEFMSIELNGAEIENQLRKIVSSGARMDGLLNISFDEYTSVSVLLPGTEEQDCIADFFRQLDNLIALHQRELEKLKNLKKACLEKMFV